jgi:hypothetical protein
MAARRFGSRARVALSLSSRWVSSCERAVVVCPTTALRSQWADAADAVGLHLDPRWRNADGAWRHDVDGVVVTYPDAAERLHIPASVEAIDERLAVTSGEG